MKFTLSILILFCSYSACLSQHEMKYKAGPNAPQWVQSMYMENPDAETVIQQYESYFQTNEFVKIEHTLY
jgi:hypothetical protein